MSKGCGNNWNWGNWWNSDDKKHCVTRPIDRNWSIRTCTYSYRVYNANANNLNNFNTLSTFNNFGNFNNFNRTRNLSRTPAWYRK